jgi:hypothetical protein
MKITFKELMQPSDTPDEKITGIPHKAMTAEVKPGVRDT